MEYLLGGKYPSSEKKIRNVISIPLKIREYFLKILTNPSLSLSRGVGLSKDNFSNIAKFRRKKVRYRDVSGTKESEQRVTRSALTLSILSDVWMLYNGNKTFINQNTVCEKLNLLYPLPP